MNTPELTFKQKLQLVDLALDEFMTNDYLFPHDGECDCGCCDCTKDDIQKAWHEILDIVEKAEELK